MIDFSINGIESTIKNIEVLKNDIYRVSSNASKIESHISYVLSSGIMDTETSINKANKDIKIIDDATTHNFNKRGQLTIAIDNALKNYESIKNNENTTQAAADAAYKIVEDLRYERSIVDRYLEELRSLRTRVSLSLSTLKEQLAKLKKAKDEFVKAYHELTYKCNSSSEQLSKLIKDCTRALETVRGVFTACKVESVSVLVEYKQSLKNSLDKLITAGNELSRQLEGFKKNLVNIDFVNSASKDTQAMVSSITDQKDGLVKNMKQLDTYINVLNAYIRC